MSDGVAPWVKLLLSLLLWKSLGSHASLIRKSPCDKELLSCADGLKCIKASQLCDFNLDCADASDELNGPLCKKLAIHKGLCNEIGYVQCEKKTKVPTTPNRHNQPTSVIVPNHNWHTILEGKCLDILSACSLGNKCLGTSDMHDICSQMDGLKLTNIAKTVAVESYSSKDLFNVMSTIHKSLDGMNQYGNKSICPPLFVAYEDRCVSALTFATGTWSESSLYCEAFTSRLAIMDDVIKFKFILDFLKDYNISSKFWIGANFHNIRGQWEWSTSKYPVELGAPFWSTYQERVEGDDKESETTVNALRPGNANGTGNCLAILEDNFYYFSDEDCNNKYSPLCVIS